MRKLFLLSVLIGFYSCNKSGPSYIKGTVYERGTNKPIEGAIIFFAKDNYETIKGTNGRGVVNSAFTDSEGRYKLEFTKVPTSTYTVSCFHDDFATYHNPNEQDYQIKHGRQALNFTMIPKAYLRIRFQRTSTSSNIVLGGVIGNYRSSFRSPYTYPQGSNLQYDSLDCEVNMIEANVVNTISWSVGNLNWTTIFGEFSADVMVGTGDTLIHTIQFN